MLIEESEHTEMLRSISSSEDNETILEVEDNESILEVEMRTPEMIIEKEYYWRDIKCFNDLKEMIDIEKVASLSSMSS